jgi:type I restriction enzyme M protein
MAAKMKNTEVDAYVFVKENLKQLGWDTRNPVKEPEIKKWLDKKRPEYIVKVTETILWVIECKSTRVEIDQAVDEAENYYATTLNKGNVLRALFVSGVAGNDVDGYIIKNKFLEKDGFRPIILNDKEMTGLLSPEITKRILSSNSAVVKDMPIDQAFFMQKAARINEILHMGAVNINDRARVMAALLLSTLQGDLPDLNATPAVLISDINTRAQNALASQGKKEFFPYVELYLPTSFDNHQKYKKALVETMKELYSLNIRSAMNSGSDVLGQFYEVFLKYGNWAQKMGIVLTPRHVTRFAVEALDVTLQDIVLDPCCGTGGFLVSAFDHVKASANKTQIDQFKKNNIFGIDQQPQLACLAIVNMIFRGDGKNNIIEGDCFTKWLVPSTTGGIATAHYINKQPKENDKAITKVLMNPSFAIEASDIKEYRFVSHALDQMVDGGLLFSILPVGAMLEGGEEHDWRKNKLLTENTLLAVVTFPPELFYPIGVHTLGTVIKKGIPHPKSQKVLWVRAIRDGYIKVKGKRLPSASEPNDLDKILPIFKAFIHNTSFPVTAVPQFCKASAIDFADPILELLPEVYLDSKPIDSAEIAEEADRLIRESAAFLIRSGKENQFHAKGG